MKHLLFCVGLAVLSGAGLVRADQSPVSVPFKLGKKQAILLPVKVAGTEAEFRLDTGLGFDLISPQLAQKLGLEPTPTKIRPVTGGELELGQARLSSLTVGAQQENDLDVIVGEPRCFVSTGGESKVDGILSLAFFRNHPFTLDFANQQLVLENSESLSKRKAAGKKVDCRLSDENVVASVSLMLKERAPEPEKPGGLAGLLAGFGGGPPEPPKAWVQVDTGCENLLLDSKLMFTLKIDATGANITETEPTDQNGRKYRSFASQMGKIEVSESPSLTQEKSPVVFRKLLAEGVLGQDFLRRYTVTFDLPNSELIFGK
ncbi:MAG: retropepsin-like domain-containing protein [Candidatus Eremiobacteraeota bacterium]|nr:retropepsin-like domain-containing protein [Candidatus Eremiobacteraeota bacterium]MCW5866242.1 retropepsin-like domain-containing protein [Candidatus Eremiobacteraeota bacterium]